MRTCKKCGLEKNDGDFYPSSKSTCKECIKERSRQWNDNNKERLRDNRRKWYNKNKGKKPPKLPKDPAVKRAKANAYRKKRYASDPDFREKSSAKTKAWCQKHPEKVKKYQADARDKGKVNGTIKLRSVRKSATQRNISFHIGIKWFREHIMGKPCIYCGGDSHNGMDRLDNSIGYEPENCVPCCHWCNVIKFTYSVSEMLEHIKKILLHYNSLVIPEPNK